MADHNMTFDKEKVSFNLARLKTNGETLELVVDPDMAVEYKTALKARKEKDMPEVGELDISEVVKSEEVFHDASRGQLASEHFIEEVFGSSDFTKIAEKILTEGEIQLTAEHRKQLRDAKKKKIIQIIHRNAVDPTTGLPHPENRIETALDNTHFKIEEYKKAEDHIEDALHALRPIIPIKFDTKKIELKIFAEYAAKVYGDLRRNKVLKENWNNDGSLTMVIEVPAGIRVEFVDKVNSMTHGNVEVHILEE